jgi:hypothetical protein
MDFQKKELSLRHKEITISTGRNIEFCSNNLGLSSHPEIKAAKTPLIHMDSECHQYVHLWDPRYSQNLEKNSEFYGTEDTIFTLRHLTQWRCF